MSHARPEPRVDPNSGVCASTIEIRTYFGKDYITTTPDSTNGNVPRPKTTSETGDDRSFERVEASAKEVDNYNWNGGGYLVPAAVARSP